jgi:hypothetical protein
VVTARVAGQDYDLSRAAVERAVTAVEPEPIRDHYVVVAGRRYPPKQVLGLITGLDRADFTTYQARAVLRRLGFGVYRRGASGAAPASPGGEGPHGGAEASLLAQFPGRWVAQEGLDVLFDADTPEAVLQWLRRHGRSARVWRVPWSPAETGSALSTP